MTETDELRREIRESRDALNASMEKATRDSLAAVDRMIVGVEKVGETVSNMALRVSELTRGVELGFANIHAEQSAVERTPYTNGNGKQNWREMVLLLVAIVGIGFSFYQILSGQNDALTSSLENADAKAASGLRELRTDQSAQRERLEAIARTVSENGKALEEIETQFCSASTVRNLQIQNLERLVAMIWPKDLGAMPKAEFWPSVGRNCGNGH